MKLIDIKDTLPVGFMPIQETIDTRELTLFLSPTVPGLVGEGSAEGGQVCLCLLTQGTRAVSRGNTILISARQNCFTAASK